VYFFASCALSHHTKIKTSLGHSGEYIFSDGAPLRDFDYGTISSDVSHGRKLKLET
jgi:hypothetical protein